jgi:hypothetical protein
LTVGGGGTSSVLPLGLSFCGERTSTAGSDFASFSTGDRGGVVAFVDVSLSDDPRLSALLFDDDADSGRVV